MTNQPNHVSVLMGSTSDWESMSHAVAMLERMSIAHEVRVLSAHRTPDETDAYVRDAEARGTKVFIAAAGGAAHLAGVVAARTTKPVLGVPMKGWALDGLDSLLSTVQMPAGIPVGTLAIGKAGAINAALLAASILALGDPALAAKLEAYRSEQRQKVLATPDPRKSS